MDYQVVRKKIYALYDLAIAQESNDYFETLTNEYKYPQLEIIYYKALNAAIKGDTNRANELLIQLGESFLVEKVKSFFVEKYFKKEENL